MSPCLASALCPAGAAPQGTIERVSVNSSGVPGNGTSGSLFDAPVLSNDGRYVAFESNATNLVTGDTGFWQDIFVRDRQVGTTTLVSASTGGAQANSVSQQPAISGNGRFVAFHSSASNLVPSDSNSAYDAFVRDLQTGATVCISVSASGALGNGNSGYAELSDDGRFVAFYSEASNLASGDSFFQDVFLHDRDTDGDGAYDEAGAISTSIVSIGYSSTANGASGNAAGQVPEVLAISGDGHFIAFNSLAPNLVIGDTNGLQDIFVRDRLTATTTRVSVGPGGIQADGASRSVRISGDGRFVAFDSDATNLVAGDSNGLQDVFVHDRVAGTTELVSVSSTGAQGNQLSKYPWISSDGRFVAFQSAASNLAPGDTNAVSDVFVHDRATGATTRVSVSSSGAQASALSYPGALSADGRYASFSTAAPMLVPSDTNAFSDVFVYDRGPSTPTAYCTAKTSSLGCVPAITSSGTPSASSSTPFTIGAQQVPNNKNGLLFYGFGPSYGAFQGGYMCVAAPIRRSPLQGSGGNAAPDDCSGSFAFDFNARIQSGANPGLIEGTVVYCQHWYRDPASASTTGLSNALVFTIGM